MDRRHIPGDHEKAIPPPGVDAIRHWTSVVRHPGELTWLRESLTLNAPDVAAHESDE